MRGKFREAFTATVCEGNPGVGGYAFAFESGTGSYVAKSGASVSSTHNYMKLLAVISAVEYLADNAVIYTDSHYVMHGIETWRHAWKKAGWRRSRGKKVQNVHLWKLLDSTLCQRPALKVKLLKRRKLYAQEFALGAAESAARVQSWVNKELFGPAYAGSN